VAAKTTEHSFIFRVLGAIQTLAANRAVTTSIKGMTLATRQLRAGMLGMRNSMMGAYASLVAMGLAARNVVSEYARYTEQQARVRTVLAATTVNYRQNYRLVQQVAEATGRDLGYSLTEANSAMESLIQTGVGVHVSMRVYRNAMELARVGNMDVNNSTRFLVDTMNMFQNEMADTKESFQDFTGRMGRQLAIAANMSSTSIENLQQAFRYAGTELSTLGYSSREVMAALAGLSTTATSCNSILSILV